MTIAIRFFERFRAFDRALGSYVITGQRAGAKIKGKATTLREEPTLGHWEAHLGGTKGLGLVPIMTDNSCIWGALDVDDYDLDLFAISQKIEEKELPVILLRTKSGGAHIYLFAREPVAARIMREKLKLIELALGFQNNEIFPKQETLGPQDFGNWINMPYFKGDDTDRYAIVNSQPLSAEEFLDHAEDIALTAAELTNFTPQSRSAGDEFDGAPPCLRYYIEHGFPEGSRNNALFSMGVFARKKFPEGWEEKVHEYNRRFMGPGTYQEVETIIRSLRKKAYAYKCKDQPLAPICNKGECLDCAFGIEDPKQARANRPCVLDDVDRPTKMFRPPPGSDDEPYYVFTIGGKAMTLTIDHLLDQAKFRRKYALTFNRIALNVDDVRWARAVNELLEDQIIEELPADAGPEGQLLSLVEHFCTGRVQARAKDELILGKPWTDSGRTFFRSQDLFKYLGQQGFRAYKEREIYPIFRRYGAEHNIFNIKGKCVKCWSFPEFAQQTEDFDRSEIEMEQESPF